MDAVRTPDGERRSLADQADYAAGLAFRGGDYIKAGRLIIAARTSDPARAGLWAERSARIHQAAREAAGRAASSQENRPLTEIVSDRLTAAGVAADSSELEFLREWNAAAAARQFSAGAETGPGCQQAQREAG